MADDTAAAATAMCAQSALFLADWTGGPLFMLFFVLALLSIGPAFYLAQLANPKLAEPIQTTPLPGSAATPVTMPATPPPAYEEEHRGSAPTTTTTTTTTTTNEDEGEHPSAYSDVQWALRRDATGSTQRPEGAAAAAAAAEEDAPRFVKGSMALGALVAVDLVLALSIQAMKYCVGWDGALQLALWVLYGGICFLSLHGVGAWCVLLRNLWGKRGREGLVLREDFLANGLTWLVRLPFHAAVALVRAAQRALCGGAAAAPPADRDDLELGLTPSAARFPADVAPRRHHSIDADNRKALEASAERQGLLHEHETNASLEES